MTLTFRAPTLSCLFAALALGACDTPREVDAAALAVAPLTNVAGTTQHVLNMPDGSTRTFLVFVPDLAAGSAPVPVVYMFHGTNSSGGDFYGKSRWVEQATQEGFIAVFPSALEHCYWKQGIRNDETKWADGKLGSAELPLCNGQPLADDVAFVDAMLAEVAATYAVDPDRFYATGFSNGGNFVARLVLERSEYFAAAAIGAGGLQLAPTPSVGIPVLVHVGQTDLGVGPLDDQLLVNNTWVKDGLLDTLSLLELDPDVSVFEQKWMGGKQVVRFTWATDLGALDNRLHFVVIEDLNHKYPAGWNHPVVAAEFLWNFFKDETL